MESLDENPFDLDVKAAIERLGLTPDSAVLQGVSTNLELLKTHYAVLKDADPEESSR